LNGSVSTGLFILAYHTSALEKLVSHCISILSLGSIYYYLKFDINWIRSNNHDPCYQADCRFNLKYCWPWTVS